MVLNLVCLVFHYSKLFAVLPFLPHIAISFITFNIFIPQCTQFLFHLVLFCYYRFLSRLQSFLEHLFTFALFISSLFTALNANYFDLFIYVTVTKNIDIMASQINQLLKSQQSIDIIITSTVKSNPSSKLNNEFLVRIKDLFSKFETLYSNLIEISSEHSESVDFVQLHSSQIEFHSLYFKLLTYFPETPIAPASTVIQQSSSISLPRINLPLFDGDVKSYQNFIGLFDATIHNNPDLSENQKFQFLRNSLRGDAL